jgi:hypothetical protein
VSVLIAGSRNPKDPFVAKIMVSEMVQKLELGMVVLNGGADGIDTFVLDEIRKLPHGLVHETGNTWRGPAAISPIAVTAVVYRPRYKRDGRAAPIIRNLHMLDLEPEMVVVLWNGSSPGSRMVYEEAGRRRIQRVLLEA